MAVGGSVLADMDAADTAIVELLNSNEASDVHDIRGQTTPLATYFQGSLEQ
jgi:hypothetical protein|tara:strand:+ start:1138 stop:1290 length:153 start_codon:yes stop_codon:yes gene_type:complete